MAQTALRNTPSTIAGTEAEQADVSVTPQVFSIASLPERGRVTPAEVLGNAQVQTTKDEQIAAERRKNFAALFPQVDSVSDIVAVQPNKFFVFVSGDTGPQVVIVDGETPLRQATKADVTPGVAKLLGERFASLKAA